MNQFAELRGRNIQIDALIGISLFYRLNSADQGIQNIKRQVTVASSLQIVLQSFSELLVELALFTVRDVANSTCRSPTNYKNAADGERSSFVFTNEINGFCRAIFCRISYRRNMLCKGDFMSKGKNQHVTPHPNGGWQVKGAGNSRATARTKTQTQAIKIARNISRNQASELVIHRPNGEIRDKDSHGHDPFPPRG